MAQRSGASGSIVKVAANSSAGTGPVRCAAAIMRAVRDLGLQVLQRDGNAATDIASVVRCRLLLITARGVVLTLALLAWTSAPLALNIALTSPVVDRLRCEVHRFRDVLDRGPLRLCGSDGLTLKII